MKPLLFDYILRFSLQDIILYVSGINQVEIHLLCGNETLNTAAFYAISPPTPSIIQSACSVTLIFIYYL